jgi:hypothetical protein
MKRWHIGLIAVVFGARLASAADYLQPFDALPKDWSAVDEPGAIMGDATPGAWKVEKSGLLDGPALHQTANTWGDKGDIYPLGTYFVYDGAEFEDFVLETDIYPADNDGLGFLFRYRDRKNHYRFLTMIDAANPENAPPKDKGPWSRFDVRLGDKGDDVPYYALLGRKIDTYKEKEVQKIRIEVIGNTFTASIAGKEVVTATDANNAYPTGKIGLVCFAQNDMWFDNVKVTDLSARAVSPAGRLTTTWARLRRTPE